MPAPGHGQACETRIIGLNIETAERVRERRAKP
jgi:hypothetical protein